MRAIETTARHSLQLANSSQLKCGAIRGGGGGGADGGGGGGVGLPRPR